MKNEITNEETVTLTKKIYEDTQAWFNAVDEKNDALQDQVRALEKRNNLLVESLWPFLEQKVLGLVDKAVRDQLEDIDITAHGYFDTAVCEVIRDYDFSDVIKEAVSEIDLDSKVAQVISNYDFSEISFISDLVEEAVADIDLDYKVADIINNGEFRFTR